MTKRPAKTRTEVPTLGVMRRELNGTLFGYIQGACGCMTHFEVCQAEYDKHGLFYRIVGLSDAKSKRKAEPESDAGDAP